MIPLPPRPSPRQQLNQRVVPTRAHVPAVVCLQDAHEFLGVCLDALDVEVTKVRSRTRQAVVVN